MGVLITVCSTLLLGYIFDISSSKTKVPSVILLLILGWGIGQIAFFTGLTVPNLDSLLPMLGNVGLILIVLEGALELELTREKIPLIIKAASMSLVSMLIFTFGFGIILHQILNVPFKHAFINAIPLSIISSAVAIPSSFHLGKNHKQFVTYESSMSDIFGVIFFNFLVFNETIDGYAFAFFFEQIIIILGITIVATVGLAYLMKRIKHHVKFAPIIIAIVLIYAILEKYKLPALLFILVFGTFVENINKIKNIFQRYKFIKRLDPNLLALELPRFKELITEMTFLVRTLFFLLFGFFIETTELLDSKTMLMAMFITLAIFIIRFLFIRLFKIPYRSLLYIAPRGLITILLFLHIPSNQVIPLVNKSLIIQVIIFTSLFMMLGLMVTKNKQTSQYN